MKIAGSWVPHRLALLRSPAWAALTLPARRILDRLEIELMWHAGKNNGDLICTYRDFTTHGIRRPSIAGALRQAVELGFVEITQRGRRSADHGCPAHYRLTYLPTEDAEPTDEWAQIRPNAKRPLISRSPRRRSATRTRPKIHFLGHENVPSAGHENVPTEQGDELGTKTCLPSSPDISHLFL